MDAKVSAEKATLRSVIEKIQKELHMGTTATHT
jgi:hypothetical protein